MTALSTSFCPFLHRTFSVEASCAERSQSTHKSLSPQKILTPEEIGFAILAGWCEEKQGDEEYASRCKAKKLFTEEFNTPTNGLNLEGLRLSSLPDCFFLLSGLERLDLTANKLTTLPDSIGSLSHLRILWLEKNSFETLPPAFCNLKNLYYLWLEDSQTAPVMAILSQTKFAPLKG